MKQGKITANGVVLQAHENATIVFLTQLGFNIELIPPNKSKGSKTPDFIMKKQHWEMKSPISAGSRTIEHAIRSASRQSENIVIDLRRSKMPTHKALSQIKFHSLKRTNI